MNTDNIFEQSFNTFNLSLECVTYYRVSTKTQHLGLDAQKEAVANHIRNRYTVVASFEEKESGKNDSRPELMKALALCRERNCVLIVSTISRLSRNLTFLSQMMDSNVKFICADMPEANSMTLGIMSVMAHQERLWISKRTKDSLTALKAKGVKLGSPQNLTYDAALKGAEANRKKAVLNPNNIKASKVARLLKQQGKTLWQIANELKEGGFLTSTGKKFKAEQVRRFIKKSLPLNV